MCNFLYQPITLLFLIHSLSALLTALRFEGDRDGQDAARLSDAWSRGVVNDSSDGWITLKKAH
jgi:hypothetical protein